MTDVLPAGKSAVVPPQPIMWPLLGAQMSKPLLHGGRSLVGVLRWAGLGSAAEISLRARRLRRRATAFGVALAFPAILILALTLLVAQAVLLVTTLLTKSPVVPPGLWFLVGCIATLSFLHVITRRVLLK